jgi:hypothetical protein
MTNQYLLIISCSIHKLCAIVLVGDLSSLEKLKYIFTFKLDKVEHAQQVLILRLSVSSELRCMA